MHNLPGETPSTWPVGQPAPSGRAPEASGRNPKAACPEEGSPPGGAKGVGERIPHAAIHDLCRILRAAATAALPPGAFLRRDRGDALFITDAPRIDPGADRAVRLNAAGFTCAGSGGLLRLWPAEIWLTRLEAATPDPPDDLCRGLFRFRGKAPDGASLKLFALGMRCLDGGEGATRFDRLLRQRAAQCLRENAMNPDDPTRGGGLYACALLDHELEVQHR